MVKKKGTIDAMGLVVLSVSIFVGIYIIGSIYTSTENAGLPAAATQAIGDTLDDSITGMTLMGVALIVMAAMGILSIMGTRI